ncbi:MAG: hypothetical protein HOV81_31085, partial [Kofleriaceae bacterium]|nr:hypothetical protein [Kofleriaceae bacterium]
MSRLGRACVLLTIASGCGRSSADLMAATPPPEGLPVEPAGPCDAEPSLLGAGLTAELAPLDATPALAATAPCIDIVRADLTRYRLRVLTSARDGASHPAPAWRDAFHLVAVTNA